MDSTEQIIEWVHDGARNAGADSPDDIVQDVMVAVLAGGRDIDGAAPSHPAAYWMAAGRNAAINEYRARLYRKRGSWHGPRAGPRASEPSSERRPRYLMVPYDVWASRMSAGTSTEGQALIRIELAGVLAVLPKPILQSMLKGNRTGAERAAICRWRRSYRDGSLLQSP